MSKPLPQILVFKTNVQTLTQKRYLESRLIKTGQIQNWTLDQGDVDCVLRIITATLSPQTVIQLLHEWGFTCAELD